MPNQISIVPTHYLTVANLISQDEKKWDETKLTSTLENIQVDLVRKSPLWSTLMIKSYGGANPKGE